jgi:hypothetical protein
MQSIMQTANLLKSQSLTLSMMWQLAFATMELELNHICSVEYLIDSGELIHRVHEFVEELG